MDSPGRKGQGPSSPNLWSVGPDQQKGKGGGDVFKKMMKVRANLFRARSLGQKC